MITLTVEARDVKVNPKMIRRSGNIPAVFYGSSHPSTPITVNKIAFVKAYQQAGSSALISLQTPTGVIDAIIHDVALDPVIGDAIHADFYIVAKDHKIEVDIPVEFVGIAPAEKLGGIVMRVLHEVRVESLPGKLPQHFIVDLSKLVSLDSQITIADIVLGDGVRSMVPLTEVVAGMTSAHEEEEGVAAAINMDAIEVEKKGKKEEEAEEAAA
ncbi:MAG: hypothetical protein A2845_03695 [Candidatus Lloydbacteria bacterium RIFCSPHIGHO2_01_FULL_49_22]|uniref:Large ribosomal subunit protein bL25 n=1 Tax=Candidatus Lloydbacteria bacterium RIFCSPHIGHO2_01_FULL_49_22 TaxID=1798658 RepID=A0A1G2CYX5_9BACT|nr:MAG: hypothetical protein A2845_03695 [Candidatus Lloydbacteria bacterium RIFCSPHIGHO2_01_FULL_49_22]OGZ09033.1 MAG: hypothetical protein A3C14_03530 [Candidatus Lloydbacteria bacterium RIFCSPHIGHO2_02_FULL_50_18]